MARLRSHEKWIKQTKSIRLIKQANEVLSALPRFSPLLFADFIARTPHFFLFPCRGFMSAGLTALSGTFIFAFFGSFASVLHVKFSVTNPDL